MSISVIVVSYNVRDLVRRCLASIDESAQAILVDNASQDGTVEMVRSEFPRVKVVAHQENLGFSVAVNAGARLATGDVFLLLNPDAQLPGGALTRMQALLDASPGVAIAGFRQVDQHGHFQLAIGPEPTFAGELGRRLVQKRLDVGDERLARFLDRVCTRGPVAWVAGSSLLVRRAAFEQVGGFDERFFLYFEDIDFCLRVRAAGGVVYYEPFLTVVHERGASANKSREQAQRAYRQSQLYFWEKHRGPWARRVVSLYLAARGASPRRLSR